MPRGPCAITPTSLMSLPSAPGIAPKRNAIGATSAAWVRGAESPALTGRTGSVGARRALNSSIHDVTVAASATTSTTVHARAKAVPDKPIRGHVRSRNADINRLIRIARSTAAPMIEVGVAPVKPRHRALLLEWGGNIIRGELPRFAGSSREA